MGHNIRVTAKRQHRSTSRTVTAAAPPSPPGWHGVRHLLPVLVISAAGFAAFSNAFGGALVLDDVRAIVQNESIRTLSPLSVPLSPPGASTVAGRPIANLTFALDYAIDPVTSTTAPRAFHLTNILIHIAAALALFGVVRRTLAAEPLRAATGPAAAGLALATSLLWVVHPLQTESVTYVVQRVESLMGLFYLLTLYCSIRAADSRRASAWMAGAIASCALGMATKEVMVTAPVVVALWDFVFLPSRRPRWRLAGGLAATWLVFAGVIAQEQRAESIAFGAAWPYLMTQTAVILHYLRLVVLPEPLVLLYDWPLVSSPAEIIVPGLAVAMLVVLAAVALWRRHPAGFAGAAFFVILSPTSSVVPIVTEVAAEHRMYLPLAIVLASVVVALYRGSARFVQRLPAGVATATAAVVVLVAALLLGVMTRERNRDYATTETIWRATVEDHPDGPRARVAYGTALVSARKFAEAEGQFRAALRLNDGDAVAHTRLGSVLAATNRFDEALPHYERAVALRPDDADANRALGQLYAMRGDERRAIGHLARAATAIPDPLLHARLASLLLEPRDPLARDAARALPYAERAATLTARRDPLVLELLSAALAANGRARDAAAVAREALAIARAGGNAPLVSRLEYRLRIYEQGR